MMTCHTNEEICDKLGVNFGDLSAREAWCIRNAVWDGYIERYLCPVVCSRCCAVFEELLTIALSCARGETKPVCIMCDNAARVTSAVINVLITG